MAFVVFIIMTIQRDHFAKWGKEKKIPLWDLSIHILGQNFFFEISLKKKNHPCHLLLFEILIEMLKIKQNKILKFY